MNRLQLALYSFVLIYLAAVLQSGWWNHWQILGCRADAFLIASGVLAVRLAPAGAGVAGFLAGVVQGGLAGANLTHYGISRLIAGSCSAWLSRLLGPKSWGVVLLAIAATTLLGNISLLFLAAPPDISGYLLETFKTLAINLLLGALLHGLLSRCWPTRDFQE